jgi:FK506-binding protein 4/5
MLYYLLLTVSLNVSNLWLMTYCIGYDKAEDASARTELITQGRLNMALCYLKQGENLQARDECTKVLETDPTNEKGLFRRGQVWI